MAWTGVRRALLAVALVGSVLAWPAPARAAGFAVRNQAQLLPGVEVQGLRGDSLLLDVGRVARGAPVRLEVVTAGAVGGGVETTSAVCQRVGGILCVNGDFAECRTCTTARGGIVHDTMLQRSPVGGHEQLRLGPAGPGAGPLGWGGALEATVTYVTRPPALLGLLPSPPVERTETVTLRLDAVNRGRGADQVVLYSPPWGPTTSTQGGDEAVLGGGGAPLGAPLAVSPRSLGQNVGSSPIPGDGMVVSAAGAGVGRLRAFWAKAADPAATRRSVVLRPSVDRPAEESVGGHPVVLAGGRTTLGPSPDAFVSGRNPRTLVGWNPAGDLVLATVDGRQPGSVGVTLIEAADVLRQLGATDGFNLDGGGSSTFVSLAPGGGRTPRVLNRPSDGTERRVTNVLAVVPVDAGAVRSRAGAPAPPPPRPAPPGPPPVDPASTDGLPAKAAPAPTTTSTAPPTTAAPTTTTEPPPPPDTAPPEVVDLGVAAPPPEPPRPKSSSSTSVPAGLAAAALVGASVATARSVRARRPRRPASPS